ncbi:hypothetical protein M569_03983 [Genlisea aurea]|uniref:WHIM2 domain-containing protein n=1 Tax=Genlisea aurea TaxID=192259 RepID=S8E4R9_9LAMI|nr:hypothetical protein M569_03983 [Genlisea aurea]
MYSEDLSNPSKREIHKLMKNGIKEQIEMKTAEQRKEFLDIEIDKRPIRTYPLGRDKHYRRYWFFRRDGRVFVQSPPDFKEWGYYQTKEEVDALIGSLNTKGEREKALKKQLQKYYHKICSELEKGGTETEEASTIPRSDRFRSPNDDPSAFLKYVNRWR